MTLQTPQEIKEQISKILVKWNMPTRQVAINEIVNLFSSQLEALKRKVETMPYSQNDLICIDCKSKDFICREHCLQIINKFNK